MKLASKPRVAFLFVGILLLWSLLILRSAHLQLVPDSRLTQLKQRQFHTQVVLHPRRGAIVDRKGRDLALSVSTYSIYVDPSLVNNRKALAKSLAPILGQPATEIQKKLSDKKKRFVWLERQRSDQVRKQILKLKSPALGVIEEAKRMYPNDSLLMSTLGWVGAEGKGVEGLELFYDSHLLSPQKKVQVRRDARGRPLLLDGMMLSEPAEGSELRLTIDVELQHHLENELQAAVKEFDAVGAHGVILDAQTSAIRAMATAGYYQTNASGLRRPRVIADTFEPGSTFKTFVIAAALRENILVPNSRYNTENGVMRIGNRVITESDKKHRWPSLTVSEILSFSSNIGTTKIAFELGPETLRKALLEFGFGQRPGVDLPGEARGTVLPLPWRPHLFSNISFGHGVTTSSLQIANAYAAVVNGGNLMTPYLVESIRNGDTGELEARGPKLVRKVLTPQDSQSMRLMLAGVTAPEGTGFNARVEAFPVGGKTGTAQKVNPQGRGYLKGAYLSSFAGFIPVQNPKFVIYVMVDEPRQKAFYGSQVAAPLFSRLAAYAVRNEGLAPVLLSEKNLAQGNSNPKNATSPVSVPQPIQNSEPLPSWYHLQEKKSDSAVAAQQIPAVMPSLTDLSLRQALQRVRPLERPVKILGNGSIISQTIPAAGEPLEEESSLTLILE